MMQEKNPSKKLSKAVLDLKFMKKSKEKALVQEENEERQQLYHDQLSTLHEGAEKIVMINSYVDCLKFLPCRLSFGGMDQDVEKLNEDRLTGLYKVVKAPPKESLTLMDADISAKEMASQYHRTPHRATPGHHMKEEEEEDAEDPTHDQTSRPSQDQKNKGGKIRPIYRDDSEGRGGGGGNFGRGRGRDFRRGGRGRGGGGGRGGQDRKMKQEGSQGGMRGCLGASFTRGPRNFNKRGHEGGREHQQDSGGWDNKKFKAEGK